MNQYEKQGFDFDPELIELFDSILQNITDEGELKDEFAKLKFIKKLDGTYNGKPGPLKQLIEKMATMEQEFTRVQLDMQRAVRDMTLATRTITEAANANTKEELMRKIKELEGIQLREQFYSWNQDGT
jgi:CRISPR/Cas system CSM-associated protein Csm2 small subunit